LLLIKRTGDTAKYQELQHYANQKLREASRDGTPLPTELRAQEAALRTEVRS